MTRSPSLVLPAWLVLAGVGAVSALPAAGHCQDRDAAERHFELGDTAGALAALERLSRRNGRDAALHYRLGVLYLGRMRPDQNVSADRRAAEEHLRWATRLAPDSAPYWLALAMVLRSQTEVTARLQVTGLLERAEAAARRFKSPALPDIEYRLGRVNWERYEQAANRYELIDGSVDIDQDRFLNDWRYVEDLFDRRLRPDFGGVLEWRQTLRHLEGALEAEPRHLNAAGLYVVALGEFDRWDSAAAFTARLVGGMPDSGHAWLLHGLALARVGRWPEAEVAFDSGLARLPPEGVAPYLTLERILPPGAAGRPAADARERTAFATRHWRVEDPLWLTPVNEPRTEFFARVTYADHRWSDDLRGYHGYDSDRGAVYLRYGPPSKAATLGPGGPARPALTIVRAPARDDPDQFRGDAAERLDRELNRLLWVYDRSRRRYLFALTPGYARAEFAGDAAGRFDNDRRSLPRSWDDIPMVASLDSLILTPLRFEDGAGRTELAVYGRLPSALAAVVGRDGGRSVALFVQRNDSVVRMGQDLAWRLGPDVWRWRVPWVFDATATLRFEALAVGGDRAGRAVFTPGAGPEPHSNIHVSDLLVAAGRGDTASHDRWFDLDVVPWVGRLPAEEPITLVWETYGLSQRATAVYTVEIRVTARSVERRGLVARIIGGAVDALGLSAVGDEVLALRYDRARAPAPALLDFVTLDLRGTAAGTYSLTVTVTDPASAQSAVAQQRIEVTAKGR